MRDYIDWVLKKAKKPVELDKLYSSIEILKQLQDSNYFLTDEDKEEIDEILSNGVDRFDYYKTPSGKYTPLYKTSFRKGRFHGNKIGEGFVISNTIHVDKNGNKTTKEEKFSITKDRCNGAVDGDYVLVDIGGNGKKPSVSKILNRNLGNVIGVVTKIGKKCYVVPIDKRKRQLNILLEGDYTEGEMVAVSLEEEKEENYYLGKVMRVFEYKEGPYRDAFLEAFKCGMPQGFSEESIKQAESISDMVYPEDKINRYDLTDWEIFSIDGADAKDKDDCVSLHKMKNGNYLLGVHISDVSYYVKEGTPIDKDAFRKGTSYYYSGIVEPQLPKKLSNGICSLNENVERLTKSVLIELTNDGRVIKATLLPTVINSRGALTYEDTNRLLNGDNVEGVYKKLSNTLFEMNQLREKLIRNRIGNNAIIFDRPEVGFKHDNNGAPTEVVLRAGGKSQSIIEEFMLLANTSVLKILTDAGIPCVYRNHDVPNSERLGEFLSLLDALGMPFQYDAQDIIEDKEKMQLLSQHVNRAGRLSPMLNANLVRCMSHAIYSSNNIGHYGTGFSIYGHFTSPMRRLADFALSRIIDECFFETEKTQKEKNIRKWTSLANDYASQASKMERVEEDVEKNVLYMDTAVYLSDYIGQEFEATIVLVSNNGICVQLDNLLEGKIRIRNLDGDYACNSKTFTLVSLNGKEDYYVGDRLKVQLISTDKNTKSVDFIVKEKIKENRIKDIDHSNQYVKSKALRELSEKAYIG